MDAIIIIHNEILCTLYYYFVSKYFKNNKLLCDTICNNVKGVAEYLSWRANRYGYENAEYDNKRVKGRS